MHVINLTSEERVLTVIIKKFQNSGAKTYFAYFRDFCNIFSKIVKDLSKILIL